jgi:undecaprenyl-diphosphatase
VTAAAVRPDRVHPREAAVFRGINDHLAALSGPGWLVMQLGSLAAVPAAAAAAGVAGRRRLARRLLVAGVSTWALSKVAKRLVGRPRPALLLSNVNVRGAQPVGLGYLSGHAGVVVALASAAYPDSDGALRAALVAIAVAVGLARIHVGAHLPLDVLGGAALGLAVSGAVDELFDGTGPGGEAAPT